MHIIFQTFVNFVTFQLILISFILKCSLHLSNKKKTLLPNFNHKLNFNTQNIKQAMQLVEQAGLGVNITF